jgi:hypothetical protein
MVPRVTPALQQKPMKTMNTYKTNDYYCSAFLMASGISLVTFARESGRTLFEFASTDELSQLVQGYYADQVRVSPIRYGNALKNMKALIYAGNTNTNTNGNHEFNHNTGSAK